MIRVALVLGFLACLLALGGPATASMPSATEPTAVAARKACPALHANGYRFHVVVVHGRVRCHRARRVLRRFLYGHGRPRGPRNGPAYLQYWKVWGWKCGHGAGGVGCSRHGVLVRAYQP